jgi:hypothetical protein
MGGVSTFAVTVSTVAGIVKVVQGSRVVKFVVLGETVIS